MNLHDIWNSVDRLAKLVTLANWGIAASLLLGFAFTVIAIKASGRKDALVAIEDLRKSKQVADTMKMAADANERATNLEHDNLTLRGQVATLETNATNAEKGLAGLRKAAADAKAAQQRVETDLAKQQERAANAERALLAIQQHMKARRITPQQRERMLEILAHMPKGRVSIAYVASDQDGQQFSNDIRETLSAAGWTIEGVAATFFPNNPVGFGVFVRNVATAPPYSAFLIDAFTAVGIPVGFVEDAGMPQGEVRILVGLKAD